MKLLRYTWLIFSPLAASVFAIYLLRRSGFYKPALLLVVIFAALAATIANFVVVIIRISRK